MSNSEITSNDTSVNPFDPRNLRVSSDFSQNLDVRKVITTIPVRKPNKQSFVRVHPDSDYSIETVKTKLNSFFSNEVLWN